MKSWKKIASALMALTMTVSLGTTAFASPTESTPPAETTPSITIENATIGQTYNVYKIFDATYGANTATQAAYTIQSDSAWYDEVSKATNIFKLTASATKTEGETTITTYNVERVEGVQDTAIVNWAQGISDTNKLPATPTASKTAETTTVTFGESDNVGLGYFLITSTLTQTETAKTIISLTNANPTAEIIDKNQKPGGGEDDKKVATDGVVTTDGKNSVQYGGEVKFNITTTATNYDGENMIKEYTIQDIMPKGMSLKLDADGKNDVTVAVAGETLKSGYTVTPNTDGFTVKVDWANETTVEGKSTWSSIYGSPVVISINYTAVIGSDFEVNKANVNTAKISYKDIKDTSYEDKITDKTETVYSYALAIKKVDKSGNQLENAVFTLSQNGSPVKFTHTEGSDEYIVSPNGTVEEITAGEVVIKGLNGDSYSLTEKTAPAGYNKLTAPVSVTPVLVDATKKTVYMDKDGNVIGETSTADTDVAVDVNFQATPVVVANFTGAELPSTGGIGTTIFYVGGGILIAAAGILLVTKKRMSAAA